jgi:hypothetical protein
MRSCLTWNESDSPSSAVDAGQGDRDGADAVFKTIKWLEDWLKDPFKPTGQDVVDHLTALSQQVGNGYNLAKEEGAGKAKLDRIEGIIGRMRVFHGEELQVKWQDATLVQQAMSFLRWAQSTSDDYSAAVQLGLGGNSRPPPGT